MENNLKSEHVQNAKFSLERTTTVKNHGKKCGKLNLKILSSTGKARNAVLKQFRDGMKDSKNGQKTFLKVQTIMDGKEGRVLGIIRRLAEL